jgi:hypothetical protein
MSENAVKCRKMQFNVRGCIKMSENTEFFFRNTVKCRKMQFNVRECSKMSENAVKCSIMFLNRVEYSIISGTAIKIVRNCS